MDFTLKHFFRSATLLIFGLLLFSCSVKKNDENLIWYENQVIEQAVPEQDSVYRIQIGMMASSFWLDNKGNERKDQLSLLQESLKQRNPLTIGVEKEPIKSFVLLNSNKRLALRNANTNDFNSF